ncbi:hypothetical protein FKM82_005298 [Ascaphus truei]
MDKGISINNPYASVSIPRAQLKSSFVRHHLGDDLDIVFTNPAAVPTYPSYTAQVQDRFPNEAPKVDAWQGNKIHTHESWRRPHNPYASEKAQNGGHPDQMYTVDLDRRSKVTENAEDSSCCCYPCCKCCPCCPKSCCVIS